MEAQFSTADLFDTFEDRCSSCETQFKQYGERRIFSGQIRTVQCLNDNVLLRRTLETPCFQLFTFDAVTNACGTLLFLIEPGGF